MNPYSGYGPAQAIRDAGTSLADVVKGYMEMELLGKKADLDLKRLDVEDRMNVQKLRNLAASQQLEHEKDMAQARYQKANLAEITRHHGELETDAAARRQTESRRVDVEEGKLKMARDEQTRLNQRMPLRQLIEESGLSGFAKEALFKSMSKEELGRVIRVRDFKDGLFKTMQDNPKLAYQEMYAQLRERKQAAEAQFMGAKTQEEASRIMEEKLLPVVSHMQNLQHVMGKGPDLTPEDIQEAHDLAARTYERAPELFNSLQDAQTQMVDGLRKARRMVYGDTGKDARWSKWRDKNIVEAAAADYKAAPDKYDPKQVGGQIRKTHGKEAEKEFYRLAGVVITPQKSGKKDKSGRLQQSKKGSQPTPPPKYKLTGYDQHGTPLAEDAVTDGLPAVYRNGRWVTLRGDGTEDREFVTPSGGGHSVWRPIGQEDSNSLDQFKRPMSKKEINDMLRSVKGATGVRQR